jgi:hypothetical protein
MRQTLIGAAVVGLFVGSAAHAECSFPDRGRRRGARTAARPSFPIHQQRPAPAEWSVRPSCGCVRPDRERNYQPGESGEIAAEVHTLGERRPASLDAPGRLCLQWRAR